MAKNTSHLMLLFKYDHLFGRSSIKTDKTKRNSRKKIITHLLPIKYMIFYFHILFSVHKSQSTGYPILHGNMPIRCDHSCCTNDDCDNQHLYMHILQQDQCKSFLTWIREAVKENFGSVIDMKGTHTRHKEF